jgi:hypothetical protein
VATIYSFGVPPNAAYPMAGRLSAPAWRSTAQPISEVRDSLRLLRCGAVFELTPRVSSAGAWTGNTVYNFSGALDNGGPPIGSRAMGANGSILGTIAFGGANRYTP